VKVRKESLGQISLLSEGGFGKVFRVDTFTLSDDAPLAYKEFTVDHAGQARSAEATVAFRAALSSAERTELDMYSVWPRAVVVDESEVVCGLLMPLIPQAFYCRMTDPHSGHIAARLRGLSWLIASPRQRAAAKIDLGEVSHTDRLILLALLVYIIGWLHERGWVFGDLSFGNVTFALNPPRVLLLDCDGTASLSDFARRQSSTPFWDPPECRIESSRRQEVAGYRH
jgi:hypothetical protein